MPRSVSKLTPASAPAPSGITPHARSTAAKRSRSRAAIQNLGEQVMGEVDRLRALQVRVAGQRPVEVALGRVDERRHVRVELRRRRAPPRA